MALFKVAHLFRVLRTHEQALAREVFGNTMPPLNTIGITNGLGQGDNVWTIDRSFFEDLQSGPPKSLDQLLYLLNFGEAVHWDLSTPQRLAIAVPGYGSDRARDVFVHELTHVWQFNRGESVKIRAVWAQNMGAGYQFKPGDSWESYNIEQQATIVEYWNKGRTDSNGNETNGEDHELFPYIHYVVRKSGQWNYSESALRKMDLPQLALMWAGEKGFGIDDPHNKPIQTTSKDNSFVIILSGGVLFDTNEHTLKQGADMVLQTAAVTITANSGPRLRAILINGHTDNTGDPGYNMRLSERRAQTVAEWFFSRKLLSRSNTKPQGFGATSPIAPNATVADRAKNRRVEIFLSNS